MRKNDVGTNPYRRAREISGMSVPDVVRASGLSPSTLWVTEQGIVDSPNPRIKEVLAAVGVDVTGLDEAYVRWRAEQSKATIKRFAAAAGGRG